MAEKPKTLSDRIRVRREELGLGKAELARRVGVSPTAVGLWETGDTKNLRNENLFTVADNLEISARELATGEPEPPPYLKDDEREMMQKYAKASPRWRLSLRLLAGIPDELQDAASEQVNKILAELSANPPHTTNEGGRTESGRGALESPRQRLFHKGPQVRTTRQRRARS